MAMRDALISVDVELIARWRVDDLICWLFCRSVNNKRRAKKTNKQAKYTIAK